ncbi:MAG: murein hydrolase activator EnvC family protein [Polyangia bacterium]
MRRLLLVGLALLIAGAAQAGRPPEALLQDRSAAEAEVHDLERRARALDEQSAERKAQLKKRLRAIYKLSSGGLLRLLAGAESASDLELRHEAMRRLLARDLDELKAVRDDSRALDADQARRASELTRAIALGQQAEAAIASEPATGLATSRGRLTRPVPGPIVAAFGSYHQRVIGVKTPAPIVLGRPGVELLARAGTKVSAIAAGQVRFIGQIPGHGEGVIVDHGDGYVSIVAGLTSAEVAIGQPVQAGARLGEAVGPTIYMELAEEGTPLDPARWLAPPTTR